MNLVFKKMNANFLVYIQIFMQIKWIHLKNLDLIKIFDEFEKDFNTDEHQPKVNWTSTL